MSHIDSDLEEGEIPDDSPSSPLSKPKELPRRYILGENKGIHQKHKKDCKYAIRRHAKRLVQLKTTPTKRKVVHKSHHKTYSHNKSTIKFDKHNNIKAPKGYRSKTNTYSIERAVKKSSFKDHTVFRPNSKPVKSKSERYPLETETVQPINDCSFSKMLENYKSRQSNNLNNSISKPNQPCDSLVQNSDDFPSLESTNLKVVENMCNDILIKSSEAQAKDEIDDIEELRKIALATCAKRSMSAKQQLLTDTNISASQPIKVSSNHISNYENHIADNYEIVDMDVDEDNQSSSDDIFIIDTKPSSDFQKEQSSILKRKTVQYCSDDDFETDLLRAELIESMYRKRFEGILANSENNGEKLHNLQVPLKYDKPIQDNLKFSCKTTENQNGTTQNIPKHIGEGQERITPVERNKSKIAPEANKSKTTTVEASKCKTTAVEANIAKITLAEVNKAKNTPVAANTAKIAPAEANKIKISPLEAKKKKIAPAEANKTKIAPVEANKTKIALVEANKAKIAPDVEINTSSPKRLIISLNGDSSSEESDLEDLDTVNALPENPVASIEALISDIRQKSVSNEINNEDDVKSVPKAVSCLSKAQQEEYNALMKILEKKKVSEEDSEVKHKITHSPKGDLKLLEKKLTVVRETLKMKKELMAGLSKEVTSKKYAYLKSKLTAQHLKEKYVAAEKERRIKLGAWSKSCKSFDAVKKSVSELENKIAELQSLCSKVGSSIQRQNGLTSIKTS